MELITMDSECSQHLFSFLFFPFPFLTPQVKNNTPI